MIKKSIAILMVLVFCLTIMVSCKDNNKDNDATSSVGNTSSENSSDTSSIIIDTSAWGSDENGALLRNSFLSADKNGDIFYCGASGGIYRQFIDSKKLSKIYSNSSYEFKSVTSIDESRICVGYTKEEKSAYIIFNLQEKTVSNAVSDPNFSNKSVYLLTFVGNTKFFLADPDRYGRYTLYKEEKDVANPIASGVNEFVVSRNRIFYNVGATIFSLNLNGEDRHVICDVETNDLLGFTVVGDMLIYMSSTETFCLKTTATHHTVLPEHLNVYTCVTDGNLAYFCGAKGGIYSLSLANGFVTRLSDYTASSLALNGDWLYLSPAKSEDYPTLEKEFIISDGIYRFPISELLKESTKKPETSSSLSQTESDTTSSSLSGVDVNPLVPEIFGK